MVLRSFWCQYWPQENIFLVKQLRYFKILMAKIQCVLSYYFASLTSIQTDDPQKNCANGQHCQFLKWFLLMVVCFCVLSLVHLSFSHVLDGCLFLLVKDVLSIQDYRYDSIAGSSEVSSVLISCRTSLVDPSAEVAWTRELYIRHEQSLNLHYFFLSEALVH